MKKIIFVAAFGLLTLASCKKDYTCTCTAVGTTISSSTTLHATKKDATTACENGSISGAVTCAIK